MNVICGDGFALDKTLGARAGEKFAAILFAIPVLNLPQERRQEIFTDLIGRLRPGGNLTQLSYAWSAPVKPVSGIFTAASSPVVWDNLPPAKVWIYSPVETALRSKDPQAPRH